MERRETISFLDLDRTLYRTDEFLRGIRQDLVNRGYSSERIDEHLASLSHAGDYTFERHLQLLGMSREQIVRCVTLYREMQKRGDTHLYDDVLPALPRLARLSTCVLLTYGHPSYQQDKFLGIGSIQGFFQDQHYVHRDRTKGEVIRDYAPQATTWFLDDSPTQLFDAKHKSPTTQLVRIMRAVDRLPPHLGDGTIWRVVPTFEAFVDLVEAG